MTFCGFCPLAHLFHLFAVVFFFAIHCTCNLLHLVPFSYFIFIFFFFVKFNDCFFAALTVTSGNCDMNTQTATIFKLWMPLFSLLFFGVKVGVVCQVVLATGRGYKGGTIRWERPLERTIWSLTVSPISFPFNCYAA